MFNTVNKLLIDAGYACVAYHSANVRSLKTRRVQADEIWSFVGCKQKNVREDRQDIGDVWTWTALDAESKLMISSAVGSRDAQSTMVLMRRFTRITNAFSKKLESHFHALALYFTYYNYVRIHKTLKVTPAMQAGISSKLWEMTD